MSVTIRERDRERDWETESYRGDREPKSFTTIRRYRVPDKASDREDDRFETSSRFSRHNVDSRDRSDRRGSSIREFQFQERDVQRDRFSRDRDERIDRPATSDYREWRIDREISRDSPRYERDSYDRSDLERYSRSTEYFARDQPQPIIIQQPQPIIIREREREPIQQELIIKEERRSPPRTEVAIRQVEKEEEHVEMRSEQKSEHLSEKKSEVNEERQIARREETSEPEDEYYFQRTTREIARRDDRREERREGRRRRDSTSHHQNDRYSDDEVYYRKTESYVDRFRDSSPHHRQHLAEGAVAGLGAAALLSHHQKKQGSRAGGIGRMIGGAALGTAGAELVTRARSRYRNQSRSRSRSADREGRRRHSRRDESHSRSRSASRGPGNLAKLGAVAAIGALAGYAATHVGKNKDSQDSRRSRSRHRRSSVGRSRSRSNSKGAENPNHRNSAIAKAGLASAAVAGLVDRVRSKSKGARSRSRVRTGVPIAVAGLGGAAIAGLYENNKAKREKDTTARQVSRSRSRSRSTSISRSRGVFRDDVPPPTTANQDHNLIEYGDDPIAPAEDYARPRSRSAYSDYGRRRGSPDSSTSSSPVRRRNRSRSAREIEPGEAVASGGIAGIAAHEASERRDRKRAEGERRRDERMGVPQESYGFGPYAQEPPPGIPPPAEYPQQFYPQQNPFVAPPNAYAPVPQFTNQGDHQPAEFVQQQTYVPPGHSEPFSYSSPHDQYNAGAYNHTPNNVSALKREPGHKYTDDVNRSRVQVVGGETGKQSKIVQFDLDPDLDGDTFARSIDGPRDSSERSLQYDGHKDEKNFHHIDSQGFKRTTKGKNTLDAWDSGHQESYNTAPSQQSLDKYRPKGMRNPDFDNNTVTARVLRDSAVETDSSDDVATIPDRSDHKNHRRPDGQITFAGKGAFRKMFQRFMRNAPEGKPKN